MKEGEIDYSKLVDEAMYVIVRKVLKGVELYGLPNKHYFFITFLIQHPGVVIPEFLKKQYEYEMTIVLQHQFYDLVVTEQYFEVSLSFEGIQHRITIPFDSIITFADPGVQFGLQFRDIGDKYRKNIKNSTNNTKKKQKIEAESASPKKRSGIKSRKQNSLSNVVSLAQFKKDRK